MAASRNLAPGKYRADIDDVAGPEKGDSPGAVRKYLFPRTADDELADRPLHGRGSRETLSVSLSASESAVARGATNRSARSRPSAAVRRAERPSPRRPAGRSAPSRGGRARGRPNSAGSWKPSPARTRDEEGERERRVGALYFPPVSSGIPAGIAHCRHGRSFIRSCTYFVRIHVRGTSVDADEQVCAHVCVRVRGRVRESARATDRGSTEIFFAIGIKDRCCPVVDKSVDEIRLDGSVNEKRAAGIEKGGDYIGDGERGGEKHERTRCCIFSLRN